MRMTRDEQKSEDYAQIAGVICRKCAALMRDGWMPPFTIDPLRSIVIYLSPNRSSFSARRSNCLTKGGITMSHVK